ncbi:MAG TPA: hypothetical protein VGL22_07635 [Terracidiphilus sp.]|jgi:hypothetical protein
MIIVLAFSGALNERAYAWHHKPHLRKPHNSHYKSGKFAELLGGKHKTPKKPHYSKVF